MSSLELESAGSRARGDARKQGVLIALCVAWCVSLATGFAVFASYKSASSDQGEASPLRFPSDASFVRNAEKPTLLMFIHPGCACSRASLAELARVLLQVGPVPQTFVVIQADGPPEALVETDITRKARGLAGVSVVVDAFGHEAQRFAATTSGHTLLYAEQGELLFSGGLTNTRGHEGPSFGQEHLLSVLRDHDRSQKHTEIFGCSLSEKERTLL